MTEKDRLYKAAWDRFVQWAKDESGKQNSSLGFGLEFGEALRELAGKPLHQACLMAAYGEGWRSSGEAAAEFRRRYDTQVLDSRRSQEAMGGAFWGIRLGDNSERGEKPDLIMSDDGPLAQTTQVGFRCPSCETTLMVVRSVEKHRPWWKRILVAVHDIVQPR